MSEGTKLLDAIYELEQEKGIDAEALIDAVKDAVLKAYRRDAGASDNTRVEFDAANNSMRIIRGKTVVEEVEDPESQISLEEARKLNIAYEPGDIIEEDVTPKSFGRIAAQTAKQTFVQKIREAERNVIYDRYVEKENEMMTGTVIREERGTYYLDFGNAEGIIPAKETIPGELLPQGKKVKVYVLEVKNTTRGSQIITSRSHPGLIKRLFELEVPEIGNNTVIIKSISREAGKRSKIAVYSEDSNVDAVGACVGARGARINAVVDELNGERIDIIPWSEDLAEFVANSLRPAEILMTRIFEDQKTAEAIVDDKQLSLAIGKQGQNVRLAAKLTGLKIDIKTRSQVKDLEEFEL
ncbi:MAG: transcription termination/antitermination protein NusA [Clostridia bacterium]|jgi:N utilization substance protein A|nr:transcription termination/antitermination protein NusA [Clostridia bacterium]MBQ6004074.1 transcription termination/antitermination protein NusA [Clostridia bacterium]MBR0437986.1 transcription termination/antitermination protein NusA [Clostridia bacterium]MBR4623422.1 transcription termination/antitermination protein NusA [Clostridia bacterium]MBR6136105.1 transcription termination/antitermination protein NusA [Clostridia bacterium]